TQGNFGNSTTAAVAFDCSSTTPNTSTSNPAPCFYASLNGFPSSTSQTNANNGTIGDNVYVDFPSSVTGITAPPSAVAPTAFMRVTVTNNGPTFFAGLLGRTSQMTSARAVCGVAQSAAPIPILVLDPNTPKSTPPQAALNIQGSGQIAIFGGPVRSI